MKPHCDGCGPEADNSSPPARINPGLAALGRLLRVVATISLTVGLTVGLTVDKGYAQQHPYLDDANSNNPLTVGPAIDHHRFPRVMVHLLDNGVPDEAYGKYHVLTGTGYNLNKVAAIQAQWPETMFLRHLSARAYQNFNVAYCKISIGIAFEGTGPRTEGGPADAGCNVYAGHWLYRAGTTLTQAINATTKTLKVANASKVQVGQYVVIYDPPAGSFNNAEHALVTGRNLSQKKLTLKARGFKSNRKWHPAGAIVAQHVRGQGPQKELWAFNMSTQSPRDANGKTFGEFYADWLQLNYNRTGNGTQPNADIAGILFDADFYFDLASRAVDANNDLVTDDGISSSGVNWLGEGLDAFYARVRTNLPDRIHLGGFHDARGYASLQGVQMENFLDTNNGDFNPNPKYKNLPSQINTYLFNMGQRPLGAKNSHNLIKTPTLTYPGNTGSTPTSNRHMRFAIGMTLIEDGYVGTHSGHVADAWWDEYSVDVTPGSPEFGKAIDKSDSAAAIQHRGWLGRPMGKFERLYDGAAFAPGQSLLPDSSFESDLNGWTGANVTVSVDTATAMDGSGSIEASEHLNPTQAIGGAAIKSPTVQLSKDIEYTLAFSAKAAQPRDIRVTFEGEDEVMPVDTSWRRYVMTWKQPSDRSLKMEFQVGRENSRVWLDSVYLFAGSAAVFRRDFENGVAIANASESTRVIALGGLFHRIDGTQDAVNNGATDVSSVSLGPRDALLLVRRDGEQLQADPGPGAPSVTLENTITTLAEDVDTTVAIKVADIVVDDDGIGVNQLALAGADAGLFEIVDTELFIRAGTVLDFETQTTLAVVVTVDDAATGTSPDDSDSLAIDITDANDPPTVNLSGSLTTLAEGSDTSSRIKIADIVVEDDPLGSNDLSLSGPHSSFFEIDTGELFLVAGAVLDFETHPSLEVHVEVDDAAVGGFPDDQAQLTLDLTDVNEPPAVVLANAVAILPENANTASNLRVADIVIVDDALGSNVLSLHGDDADLFEITAGQLMLLAGTVLDPPNNPTLDVTIHVDDATVGATPDGMAAISVTISGVNAPPSVSLQNTTATVAEDIDLSAPVQVATIVVSDDGQGDNDLSLSGDDAALFEINGNALFLRAGAVLDFETNAVLAVTVVVDDPIVGTSPDSTSALTIDVTDANDAPTVALLNAASSIAEDANTGAPIKVADVLVTDDSIGVNTLTLSGPDASTFEIVAAELFIRAGSVLQPNTTLGVTVEVDDTSVGATPDDSASLAILVTDVNDPPSVSLANVTSALAEDTDTSSAVPVADIIIDDDTAGNNLLALSGDDAGLFEITGNTLFIKAGAILDFETDSLLQVTVEVDDTSVGNTPDDSTSLAITITDVNDPPGISLLNIVSLIAEDADTSAAITVADITVSDDSIGNNLLGLSGPDAALFEITSNQVRLRAGSTLDFETQNTLQVTVEIDDPGVGSSPDDSAGLSIDLGDVNEPPAVTLANTITSLPEDTDTTSAVKVADILVNDDAPGTNVLSLAGADAAVFELNATELFIRAGTALVPDSSLNVSVEVDDVGVGNSPDDSAELTVAITAVAVFANRIGDYVWHDTDRDGIQDNGETGLADVVIQLQDCNNGNAVVTTTTSDGGGDYLFESLMPGSYRLQVTAPGGYVFSPKGVGVPKKDSSVDATGLTQCYSMHATQSRTGVDVGLHLAASPGNGRIGDYVWQDSDRDGIQDNGESGKQGVEVRLLDCNNSDQLIDSMLTDSAGGYLFTGLGAGTYRIQFVLPSGFEFSPKGAGGNPAVNSDAGAGGRTSCLTLTPTQSRRGIDAGMYPAGGGGGSIGDYVWTDSDRDGIQDNSESGRNGVVVRLQDCNNGNQTLTSTTTNNQGAYLFSDLSPGNYRIKFVKPSGFKFSPRFAGNQGGKDSDANSNGITNCSNLNAGQNRHGIDAGLHPN